MEPNTMEYRLMVLQCLRENTTNSRMEQQKLLERIEQAIVQSRANLEYIRQLNVEIQDMKINVESALATCSSLQNDSSQDPEDILQEEDNENTNTEESETDEQ